MLTLSFLVSLFRLKTDPPEGEDMEEHLGAEVLDYDATYDSEGDDIPRISEPHPGGTSAFAGGAVANMMEGNPSGVMPKFEGPPGQAGTG